MTVDKAESYVFQGTITEKLPMTIGGKGATITIENPKTKEVKTVLDGCSGAAVASVGYGDQEIIDAMKKAAETSTYSFPSVYCNYAAEELGEFICQQSPAGAFCSALWTCSGSESNENAMKIMKQYHVEKGDTKRYKFVARKQSYHGFTIGSLSLGHNFRAAAFQDILLPKEQTPKVSQCYPYRLKKDGESDEAYVARLVKEVEDVFIASDPSTICGFTIETVGGSTYGNPLPLPGYLDGVRDVCHKYGILFHLDEVMCGMGRCGTLHAWEQFLTLKDGSEGFVGPDLQCVGKTLGGGYVTIAGILVSPKVRDAFSAGSGKILGAQTYHSHAFNCAVALAVQKKVAREGLIQNIAESGNYLGSKLQELVKTTKIVGEARGRGGFWSIEFVKNQETKEIFPVELDIAHKFQDKLWEYGATGLGAQGTVDGVNGDHILFAPSYVFTKADADNLAEMLYKSCKAIEAEYL